ncbi:AraC family transcriptional regulator [uncultured Chitinophaga sp.]|uniref:helix-turn-helix domain-containing protein n=1 Tax=uncultured Chitinophaga sp. TaxID=339340 RepID=UPI0025D2724D|nr:helix-turn-helix domain-containing protein [uncultured Chitinophaga sp.]
MSTIILQPPALLNPYVSHFWAAPWQYSSSTTYYATANTNTELAFGFQDTTLSFSTVLGHTKSHRQFPMNASLDLFGVSLYSHAVPYIFDISVSELREQVADMAGINATCNILNERMATTITTNERYRLLSNWLLKRILIIKRPDEQVLNVIRHIRRAKGITQIRQLAATAHLSQKQFERRFAGYTGFNPKLYARIIRFEQALWDRKRYDSLTSLAHAYGYYDQAHFIHDFKSFSGYNPQSFFSLAGY